MKQYSFFTSLFIVFIFLGTLTTIAQTTTTIRIEIDPSDFERQEVNGEIFLSGPHEYSYSFYGNDGDPALLSGYFKFLLPDQEKIKNVSFQITDSIAEENITLGQIVYRIGNIVSSPPPYELKHYPFEMNFYEWKDSGYRLATIGFLPFSYDAVTKTIYWAKNIVFTIETERVEQWEYNTWVNFDNLPHDLVNPEVFWEKKKIPSIVGAVWSYVNFHTTDSGEEYYDFYRYTVLDEPRVIGENTYYPMVRYTTCEYSPQEQSIHAYLREEGCRIYQYLEQEEKDTMLYDFGLGVQPENCLFQVVDGDTLYLTQTSNIRTAEDNNTFRLMMIRCPGKYNNLHEWIDGIGNIRDYFAKYDSNDPYNPIPQETLLNYYRSGDGEVVYKNPFTVKKGYYTDYKPNDCALGAEAIEETLQEKSTVHLQTIGSTLFCTSPTAVKVEVFTIDAVKVGEASFFNGEAMVKVNKAPSTYLYIVTYPDGRRESGKVVVK